MKKFLKDLENELKNLKINSNEIKEILADHEEMMEEALKEGLSEEELVTKFGNPSKLAKDLYEDSKNVHTNLNQYVEEGEFAGIEGYELYKSFEVEELKEITVKLVSEDISVYPYDGNQIEVLIKEVSEPEKFEITFESGSFKIIRKSSKLFISFSKKSSGQIIVRYPKLAKLEDYHVETVSGDCVIKGIDTTTLKVKSTSGDFNVQGVNAEKGELSTVSGDFVMVDMEFETVSMSSVSGDCNVKDLKVVNEISVNTVSGDFQFRNTYAKNASLSSVSGDINGQEFYVDTVDLKSVSGDINITNHDKTKPIAVGRKRTISGDLNIS